MRRQVKTWVMRSGFAVLKTVGADRWLARQADWHGAVLMLHRVRPASTERFQPNGHLEITPEFLDLVLTRLAERKVPVISLAEAAERMADGRADGRFAVLTFDDGYRDNLEHALPVLEKHKVPFSVFVATGMIDRTANAWWMALEEIVRRSARIDARAHGLSGILECGTLAAKHIAFDRLFDAFWALGETERDTAIRALAESTGFDIAAMLDAEMMTWDEVRTLAASPLASIGGHTVSHPALAMLDDEAARKEILDGLDRLEAETGRRPDTFAYPYGSARAVSARDRALVAELGLKVAVTTDRGMLGLGLAAPLAAWPRVSLNGGLQSSAALDVLLSGVPFLLNEAGRRLAQRLLPATG